MATHLTAWFHEARETNWGRVLLVATGVCLAGIGIEMMAGPHWGYLFVIVPAGVVAIYANGKIKWRS